MSKKNVKKRPPDIFQTFFGPFKAVFMTLNAPKGARREAPRPFGVVFGHQNGFKRSKKGPEKVWGPFFDLFLTSCRSPAGPQDLFLTFFGPFVGDPQKSAPGHFLDIFRRILENPVCNGLAHCKVSRSTTTNNDRKEQVISFVESCGGNSRFEPL